MALIGSQNWAHSDMHAGINISLSYDSFSRSGNNVSYVLTASASVGGTVSWWNYDCWVTISSGGQSQNYQLWGNGSHTSGYGGSAQKAFSFDVGTGSGSEGVSAHFWSTSDPNSCKDGPTISGSIGYDSTNRAPNKPTFTVSPAGIGETFTIHVNGSDPDGDTHCFVLYYAGNDGSTGGWHEAARCNADVNNNATFNFNPASYFSDSKRGVPIVFGVGVYDSKGATGETNWYGNTNGGSTQVFPWNRRPYATSSVNSTTYSTSVINLSWAAASDPDGQAVTYKINVYVNDVWKGAYSSNTNSYNVLLASTDSVNTKYQFGIVTVDSFGTTSSETRSGYCYKVVNPNPPSSVNMLQEYGTNIISVKWYGATPSCTAQSISKYHVYLYKAAAGYSFNYSSPIDCGMTPNGFYTYNISGDAEGTQYQFKIASIFNPADGYVFESTLSNGSDVSKKDIHSYTPSDISTYDSYYRNKIYFVPTEIIKVKWTNNGDVDFDQTICFILDYRKQQPGSSFTDWSPIVNNIGYTTLNTSYDFTMDSNDPRGTIYQFRVRSASVLSGTYTDGTPYTILGFSSDYNTMSYYAYKNLIPNLATNFAPAPDNITNYVVSNPNRYCYETNISFNWSYATNNDLGQSNSYSIYVKKAAPGSNAFTDWTIVTSGLNSNSYTLNNLDSNGDIRGTQYIFGIQTFDGLEYSSVISSNIVCHKNYLPAAPSIIYPNNGSSIYSSRPRLLITINNELDGQGQILCVKWNGTEYNSKDNSSYFSRYTNTLSNGEHMVFMPPVNGTLGYNSISIRTYDGYNYSSYNNYNVNIIQENFTLITSSITTISSTIINELRTTINALRNQYSITAFSYTNTDSTNSKIKLIDIQDLRKALDDIKSLINNWDSKNTNLLIPDIWTKVISDGNISIDKLRIQIGFDSFIDIDSNASGTSYTGSWNDVQNQNCFGGNERRSNTVGSVLFYTFNGIGIEWYGTADISTGIARVSIDQGTPIVLDLCSKTSTIQKLLFHKLGMNNGQHSIRIEVLGGSNLYIDNSYFNELKSVMANI